MNDDSLEFCEKVGTDIRVRVCYLCEQPATMTLWLSEEGFGIEKRLPLCSEHWNDDDIAYVMEEWREEVARLRSQ